MRSLTRVISITAMPSKNKTGWKRFQLSYRGPILYETINTRLIRRPETIVRFESILRAQDTVFIDDSPYRRDAYEDVLARARTKRNAMSLVDAILCAILADPNVRIDAMLTFNIVDFDGICREQGVELL